VGGASLDARHVGDAVVVTLASAGDIDGGRADSGVGRSGIAGGVGGAIGAEKIQGVEARLASAGGIGAGSAGGGDGRIVIADGVATACAE